MGSNKDVLWEVNGQINRGTSRQRCIIQCRKEMSYQAMNKKQGKNLNTYY